MNPPSQLSLQCTHIKRYVQTSCELDGATYLVIVDRYSGWPSVKYYPKMTATSNGLVYTLRERFLVFGVPEELLSDNQSTYTSQVTRDFLEAWGVKHRLSSSYDTIARALLTYRNTPMQGVKLSPAQIVFSRELRDTMPFKSDKGAIHKE